MVGTYGPLLWFSIELLLTFLARHKVDQVTSINLFRVVNALLEHFGITERLPPYKQVSKFMEKFITKIEKIDVCPDDHMVFYGKDSKLNECKVCKKKRLKPSGKPWKQFIYLGFKGQLQQRFKNPDWISKNKLKPPGNSDTLGDIYDGKVTTTYFVMIPALEDFSFHLIK